MNRTPTDSTAPAAKREASVTAGAPSGRAAGHSFAVPLAGGDANGKPHRGMLPILLAVAATLLALGALSLLLGSFVVDASTDYLIGQVALVIGVVVMFAATLRDDPDSQAARSDETRPKR